MKKPNTSAADSRITESNKILPALLMTALFITFSVATFAQTQKAAEQKANVKTEGVTHQPSHEQNATPAPADAITPTDRIVEGPALNDAIINVKDEKQYTEQKKKEQEKKNTEPKNDTPK